EKLKDLTQKRACLALVERTDLRPGLITIQLSAAVLEKQLGCQSEQTNRPDFMIAAPFQMRRRGVELKLHLRVPPPDIDQTLVQNIIKGRRWLSMVLAGKTFSEIAEADGVSKRRVQDVASLALLAPDVLGSIVQGEQPESLTTDYLIKTRFPAIWSEQREQFAAL
ncbi:MAG: hypothetical protein AAFN59_01990, partial [Pseudomonadota bacterium]